MRTKTYYGKGALINDQAPGAQSISRAMKYHGGRYFISESMSRETTERICVGFGWRLQDQQED